MALAGADLETIVSEPDALTTRPPPCAHLTQLSKIFIQRSTTPPIDHLLNCFLVVVKSVILFYCNYFFVLFQKKVLFILRIQNFEYCVA